jgi:type III secretory pathway component EscU
MSAVEIVALAASFSLLSGWRLYFSLLAAGLAMRFHVINLPDHLASLDILANPWVLGVAAVGFAAEFFADKIAWLDTAWDSLHTVIRPVGGALLALAIVDPNDPAMQIITFLLGGGGALLSHSVKSSTRAVVNASPEPFSNAVVSAGEDVATMGLAALALSNPVVAVIIAVVMLIASIIALIALRNIIRRIGANMKKGPGHFFGLETEETPPPSS